MKIVSLNINQGLGNKHYTNVNDEEKKEIRKYTLPKLMEYIKSYLNNENTIIFLHEVDKDTEDYFKNNIKPSEYDKIVKYPASKKSKFCTLALTRDENWNVSSGKLINRNINFHIGRGVPRKLNNSYENRYLELTYNSSDFHIIGAHIPIHTSGANSNGADADLFWDAIKHAFKVNKSILLIGDLNVFDLGTVQKKKFNELLSLQAVDIWTEKMNPHYRPTANTKKRIDYAISSLNLFDYVCDMKIDDSVRNLKATDHSALIVEINKAIFENPSKN